MVWVWLCCRGDFYACGLQPGFARAERLARWGSSAVVALLPGLQYVGREVQTRTPRLCSVPCFSAQFHVRQGTVTKSCKFSHFEFSGTRSIHLSAVRRQRDDGVCLGWRSTASQSLSSSGALYNNTVELWCLFPLNGRLSSCYICLAVARTMNLFAVKYMVSACSRNTYSKIQISHRKSMDLPSTFLVRFYTSTPIF